MAVDLRPYQRNAVRQVFQAWSDDQYSVVLCMPVGGGKTRCAEACICHVLDKNWAQVFYIAHTETLIDQPAQRFADSRIRHAYIKAGRKRDSSALLQFCSAQTLIRRDVTPAHSERAVVIVDEAHHIKTSTYIEIISRLRGLFRYVYLLLLTATPYRLDGRGLADVAQVLIEGVTSRELVDAGVILSPHYWAAPLPEPKEGETTDDLFFRPKIVGDIVDTWLKRAEGLPTICRAYSIPHSKHLVERFHAAGVRAAHIDGTMTTQERRRLLVGVAIGGSASSHPLALDVLCAGSNIFDEGYDSRASYEMLLADPPLPELADFGTPDYQPLSVLIDAAPTASMGSWIQRQGRISRSWPGKTKALVFDHGGNLLRFGQNGTLLGHTGFSLTSDAAWCPKIKPKSGVPGLHVPKPVVCPKCLCVNMADTETCSFCGGPTKVVELPEEDTKVELVKTAPEKIVTSTPSQREAYLRNRYREMVEANRERAAKGLAPYKPGWPSVRFKARFGYWPDHNLDAMIRREFHVDRR